MVCIRRSPRALLFLLFAALLASCGSAPRGAALAPDAARQVSPVALGRGEVPQPPDGALIALTGAGATFPAPLYQAWFDAFMKRYPHITITYHAVGSGAGVQQFSDGVINFGASDAPMADKQIANIGGPTNVIHIPTVLGAVVPIYNLPGQPQLRFSGPVLADIFLGTISQWNDPALVALNPGVALPASPITVVHRFDSSGTTYVWADYLSKVSPSWANDVGVAPYLYWPVGMSGRGNDGVAGLVHETPYTLGYAELNFALTYGLRYGSVQNKAGAFITPSPASISAAAAGSAAAMPDDLRLSLTDCACPEGYPITSYTYLLVNPNQTDARTAQTLTALIWWALHEGSALARDKQYVPLPPEVLSLVEAKLGRIAVGGTAVLQP